MLIILVTASLQSAVKLTLLPRLLRLAVVMVAVMPVFFLEKRVASLNLQDITAYLNDSGNLSDLCALVVVQELLSLIIGISLVSEIELGVKRHYWKYAVLAPSLLMPVGVLYFQALGFNYLVRYDFTTLTWAVAGSYAVLILGLAELAGVGRADRFRRTSRALNASWLLLMLAVFLPVVATCRISGVESVLASWQDVVVFALLAGAVFLSAAISYVIKRIIYAKGKR